MFYRRCLEGRNTTPFAEYDPLRVHPTNLLVLCWCPPPRQFLNRSCPRQDCLQTGLQQCLPPKEMARPWISFDFSQGKLSGNLGGVLQDFFGPTNQAWNISGKFRSTFCEKIRSSKKDFVPKFALQMCHLKTFGAIWWGVGQIFVKLWGSGCPLLPQFWPDQGRKNEHKLRSVAPRAVSRCKRREGAPEQGPWPLRAPCVF